jgi:protein-arginine kinase activator protein McsA
MRVQCSNCKNDSVVIKAEIEKGTFLCTSCFNIFNLSDAKVLKEKKKTKSWRFGSTNVRSRTKKNNESVIGKDNRVIKLSDYIDKAK